MQDMTILVVDDMRSMRAIVKSVLQDMGYERLHEAADGNEALAVLRNHAVDLVISDVEMPKMDGIELLHEVRQDSKLATVPFIMLTAMNQRDKVVEILGSHVSDFVLKPINPKILEDRIKAFIKSRDNAQGSDAAQESAPQEDNSVQEDTASQEQAPEEDVPDLDI